MDEFPSITPFMINTVNVIPTLHPIKNVHHVIYLNPSKIKAPVMDAFYFTYKPFSSSSSFTVDTLSYMSIIFLNELKAPTYNPIKPT